MTNKEIITILEMSNPLRNVPEDMRERRPYSELKEAYNRAIEALENQKIGHWIRQKGIYGLADTCECSVCGRTIYAGNENDLKDYPYCHCGAKMEGE